MSSATTFLPPTWSSLQQPQSQSQLGLQPPSQQQQDPQPISSKTEVAGFKGAENMISERGATEKMELTKWKNATWGQIFCRILQVFLAETFACTTTSFLLALGAATGLGRMGTSLLDFFVTIFVLSRFTRENAGHLSPAFTIILTVMGKLGLPWFFSIVYFLAQAIGWTLGVLFVWALTPGNDRSLGLGLTEIVGVGYTPGQAFGMEIIASVIVFGTLLHFIMADGELNYYEQTSGKQAVSFILAVASTKAAVTLVASPISGAQLGWYRYFFSGVMSGNIDSSNWWASFGADIPAVVFILAFTFIYSWIDNAAYRHTKESFVAKKYKRI